MSEPRVVPTVRVCETAVLRFIRLTAFVVLLGAVYSRLLRTPILNWGATKEEAFAALPGDELLEDADGIATRAIEIDAPPAAIWPWLAQMGPAPRGGAYTYDWIENLLGLNMHSVDRVLPEYQHPQIGDTLGYGSNRMRVERVESEHVLAWRSEDGNWVWTFVIESHGGSTRLISRNRFCLPTMAARAGMALMEPASLVMERKMLQGIKLRAERLHRQRRSAAAPPCPRFTSPPSGLLGAAVGLVIGLVIGGPAGLLIGLGAAHRSGSSSARRSRRSVPDYVVRRKRIAARTHERGVLSRCWPTLVGRDWIHQSRAVLTGRWNDDQ